MNPMPDARPSWAWSTVGDPSPYHPKCDRCDAFARWSIARAEDVGPPLSGRFDWFVRWFACGTHLNRVLIDADWLMDEVHVYDLTYPPERS